eukprot:UN10966
MILVDFVFPIQFERNPALLHQIATIVFNHSIIDCGFGAALVWKKRNNWNEYSLPWQRTCLNIDERDTLDFITPSTINKYLSHGAFVKKYILNHIIKNDKTEQYIEDNKLRWIFCEIVPYSKYDKTQYNKFCEYENQQLQKAEYNIEHSWDISGNIMQSNEFVNDGIYCWFFAPKLYQYREGEIIEKVFDIQLPNDKLSALIFCDIFLLTDSESSSCE